MHINRSEPIEIFFSYSHADEDLMNKVREQLRIHERLGLIEKWHDREIPAGTDWKDKIDTHLFSSKVILVFLSSNFIDSNYCYDVEMQAALDRHEKGDAILIPVILRPCQWKKSPLGKLEALPTDGKPINTWTNIDEATNNVAEGIMLVVNKLFNKSLTKESQSKNKIDISTLNEPHNNLSDEDIFGLLLTWWPRELIQEVTVNFNEVDKQLSLPPGSTKKHIDKVAEKKII
ncbi:MAG: toll/interleukin-1 receptor domain-containing protein [Candidatus Hodarchaeales archaeon]|jgi:hypothetical protein